MAIEPGSLYQDPLLTNVAVNHKNRAMIAERVLTPVAVPKKTFKYLEWSKDATFKLQDTRTAPNAAANLLQGLSATKKSGEVATEALGDYTDPQEVELAGPLALQAYKTEALKNAMLLRQEYDVAQKLTDPNVMTANTTLVGNAQWSDYVNSDPATAILNQADLMLVKPNVFIAGRTVITKLRRHPKILDVTKYTQLGKVSMEALAEYLEVDEILVGESFVDIAPPGQPTNNQFVWGKNAILGYRTKEAPNPLMEAPTMGYLARWGTSATQPWRTYTGRPGPHIGTGEGSTYVKVETDKGIIISAPSLAFLFLNAVA